MTKRHWQASYGTIPTEINAEAHRSVVSMLEGAMQQFADKPAFRCLGQTVSYADVDRQSRAFAAYLQNKLGVKKGDRVAVMCPNLIAFPIAMLGIIRTGAAQVNVNPLYTPRELEYQLNDAGVNIIVVYSGVIGHGGRSPREDETEDRHHRRPGRRHHRPTAWSRGRSAAGRGDRLRRCLERGRGAAVHAGRCGPGRSSVPAIYRRHDGTVEGRGIVAPQSRGQRRAVQGVHAQRSAAGQGSDRHRDSALSYLRADGELHHLLLDRRR